MKFYVLQFTLFVLSMFGHNFFFFYNNAELLQTVENTFII